MTRQPLQIEQRFVGQERQGVEARNIGDRRRRAGGDDETARADEVVSGSNGVFIDEPGGALQNLDAKAGKTLDAVVRGDAGDDLVDTGMKAFAVDDRLAGSQTEAIGHADRLGVPRGSDQRFRRHAPMVEAIAAHQTPLDQDDGNAEGGGTCRHGKPGSTATDHADIRIEDRRHTCSTLVRKPCGATIRV